MPSITASGIGSGLDVKSIFSQLMDLECIPLDSLEAQERQFEGQLSEFGHYKSALPTFKGAMDKLDSLSSVKIFIASSRDEEVQTASAGDSAGGGTFDVNVTALASHKKFASNALSSSTDPVGTGSLNIAVDTDSFDVSIDGTNNTLAGIGDAINNSGENTGVNAALLNTAEGVRLILTADESIKDSVQEFADAYNELVDITTTLRSGELAGESTLLTVQSTLLSVVGTQANIEGSAFSYMSEVGFSLNREGRMSVDSTRLNSAMDTDFHGFTNVFAHETEGFAARMSGLVDSFMEVDGLIESREDGLTPASGACRTRRRTWNTAWK